MLGYGRLADRTGVRELADRPWASTQQFEQSTPRRIGKSDER
jgi:hypothetical protein